MVHLSRGACAAELGADDAAGREESPRRPNQRRRQRRRSCGFFFGRKPAVVGAGVMLCVYAFAVLACWHVGELAAQCHSGGCDEDYQSRPPAPAGATHSEVSELHGHSQSEDEMQKPAEHLACGLNAPLAQEAGTHGQQQLAGPQASHSERQWSGAGENGDRESQGPLCTGGNCEQDDNQEVIEDEASPVRWRPPLTKNRLHSEAYYPEEESLTGKILRGVSYGWLAFMMYAILRNGYSQRPYDYYFDD